MDINQAINTISHDFNDRSLIEKAFIAAGAKKEFHDGNRTLACVGEPLMIALAAQILQENHTPRKKLNTTLTKMKDKSVHATVIKAWKLENYVTLCPRSEVVSNTTLSATLCAIVGAVWEDSKRHVEETCRFVRKIVDAVNQQLDSTHVETEISQSADRSEPSERFNDTSEASRTPISCNDVSGGALNGTLQDDIGDFDIQYIMPDPALQSGYNSPPMTIEHNFPPDSEDVPDSLELTQTIPYNLMSAALPMLDVPQSLHPGVSEDPAEIYQYLDPRAYASPLAPESGEQSSYSPSIQQAYTVSQTNLNKRHCLQETSWIKEFLDKEERKYSNLQVLNPLPLSETFIKVWEECYGDKKLALLASAILPSSDSMIGVQRLLSSYRRLATDRIFQGSRSMTDQEMVDCINGINKNIEHGNLIIRILALKLYRKHCVSTSGITDHTFVINTDQRAYSNQRPGNPRLFARKIEVESMLESIYPDLNRNDESYKYVCDELRPIRRLGEKMHWITGAFDNKIGLLGLMFPHSQSQARHPSISNDSIAKSKNAHFESMVKIMASRHHGTILEAATAMTPIIEGIFSGSLGPGERYLIEDCSVEEINALPAGSPYFVRLLGKCNP